jgi:periplasmic divalent cation tolerance protein
MFQSRNAPAVAMRHLSAWSAMEAVAPQTLDERPVACANIFGPMRSLLYWPSGHGEAEEAGVLFKTDAAVLERAAARIAELHPCIRPAP